MGKREIDLEGIKKIIPHREPFLFIDRVILGEDDMTVTGYKYLTGQEDFFRGHFPDNPIMPGVLILESMAQTACVLFLALPDMNNTLPYFMSIGTAKFRKPVLPGDTIRIEINILRARGRSGKVRGEAFVNDELATESEFMFMLVDKPKK